MYMASLGNCGSLHIPHEALFLQAQGEPLRCLFNMRFLGASYLCSSLLGFVADHDSSATKGPMINTT